MSTRRDLRARLERSAIRFGSPLALLFTAIAVALRWLLDPWLGNSYPLVTLYGAVAAAVWVGGRGPGILAAAWGYCATQSLFIEPRGSVVFPDAASFVGLLAYLVTSAIVIGLGNEMRS